MKRTIRARAGVTGACMAVLATLAACSSVNPGSGPQSETPPGATSAPAAGATDSGHSFKPGDCINIDGTNGVVSKVSCGSPNNPNKILAAVPMPHDPNGDLAACQAQPAWLHNAGVQQGLGKTMASYDGSVLYCMAPADVF